MSDRLADAIVALIIALGAWAPRLWGQQRDLRRELARERREVERLEGEVHTLRLTVLRAGGTLPETGEERDDDT